ncbi:MAG: membrane protein insertase YidC [Candidatus Hydrogenedentes bacterium]|nr:membrane protein insertase YidC [Candidatus Hydrogenedentota bacterium]
MDEHDDKQMVRNQLIAIVLMTVLFFVWMQWFLPPPTPKPPVAPTGQTAPETAPEPERTAEAEPPAAPVADASQWPFLPPVPTEVDAATDEVTIQDERLRLVFTRIGGRLKQAHVLLGKNGANSTQLVPEAGGAPDAEAVYPLGLRFVANPELGDELDRRRFDAAVDATGKSVTFTLTLPGAALIRKTFALTDKPHVLDVKVDYQNLEPQDRAFGLDYTPAYVLNWGPGLGGLDPAKGDVQTLLWRKGGLNESLPAASIVPEAEGKPFQKSILDPEWVALASMYFVAAFRPEFTASQVWITSTEKAFRVGLAVPAFRVASQAIQENLFQVYLGPKQLDHLGAAWATLPTALRFFDYGILDWFAKTLLHILNWFHKHLIANYGVAIILLTFLVRVVMFPLTIKQMKSMKKMQLLAPELEELKKKYGEDAQELQRKMMEMYRERGVNPLGGCLPVLVQFPVFIALYRMLAAAFELRGAPFLGWITDLSQPDHFLHLPWLKGVPLLGYFEYINLLPILGAVAMVLSTKLMSPPGPVQNPQQKMIMTIMPVMFSFFCYNLQSGLNLYILTSTIFGIIQQSFTTMIQVSIEPKKKTVRKRQHFYTAAQARKRRLAKEAKQRPRRNESSWLTQFLTAHHLTTSQRSEKKEE